MSTGQDTAGVPQNLGDPVVSGSPPSSLKQVHGTDLPDHLVSKADFLQLPVADLLPAPLKPPSYLEVLRKQVDKSKQKANIQELGRLCTMFRFITIVSVQTQNTVQIQNTV